MKILYFAAAAGAALAFTTPASAQADVKVNQLIVYGKDACPQSTQDEITVCARRPETDRFRIPEQLRNVADPANSSWANKALELQYVGRSGIGSCSPSGPGGATGCLQQFINQARAERAGSPDVDWNAMIEQARQERLGRIDAQAEVIEREQSKPR
jgi:hypothetical protein